MNQSALQQLGWRTSPGILSGHASTVLSVHSLFGYFLKDRTSPSPLPGRDGLAHATTFEWGIAPPLEKDNDGVRLFVRLLYHGMQE